MFLNVWECAQIDLNLIYIASAFTATRAGGFK